MDLELEVTSSISTAFASRAPSSLPGSPIVGIEASDVLRNHDRRHAYTSAEGNRCGIRNQRSGSRHRATSIGVRERSTLRRLLDTEVGQGDVDVERDQRAVALVGSGDD